MFDHQTTYRNANDQWKFIFEKKNALPVISLNMVRLVKLEYFLGPPRTK